MGLSDERVAAHLVFLVRVEQKDIDGLQLLDIAVSLELLSHLCANGRDGHVERVHLLDLGGLRSVRAGFRRQVFLCKASYSANPLAVGLQDSLLGIVPVDGCKRRGQRIGAKTASRTCGVQERVLWAR